MSDTSNDEIQRVIDALFAIASDGATEAERARSEIAAAATRLCHFYGVRATLTALVDGHHDTPPIAEPFRSRVREVLASLESKGS